MTKHRRYFVSLAGYHAGGLGQHLSYLIEWARSHSVLSGYMSSKIKAGDEKIAQVVLEPWGGRIGCFTPIRFIPGVRAHVENELFDRRVAKFLRVPLECLVGINGQASRAFTRAQELGCERLELIAATSHVNHVRRQHDRAREQFPIEPDWLSEGQRRKTLREYDCADTIYVSSQYARQTFLDEGIQSGKLKLVTYSTDPRFRRATTLDLDDVFRVVYCGAMTVTKGLPVLIQAFAKLQRPKAELVLIGGCATRVMRKWLDAAVARDNRIRWSWGDPLPHYQRASVCVHPSYQDGLGYSTMEALACGVPIIVSENTGAKQLVREQVNGFVIPTGKWEPILERLEFLYDHPLRGTF